MSQFASLSLLQTCRRDLNALLYFKSLCQGEKDNHDMQYCFHRCCTHLSIMPIRVVTFLLFFVAQLVRFLENAMNFLGGKES